MIRISGLGWYGAVLGPLLLLFTASCLRSGSPEAGRTPFLPGLETILAPKPTSTPSPSETPTPTLKPTPDGFVAIGKDWQGTLNVHLIDQGCFVKKGKPSFEDDISIQFHFKTLQRTMQGMGNGMHTPLLGARHTPDPTLAAGCPNFQVTVGGTHDPSRFYFLFFPSKEGGCGGVTYSSVILALFTNTQFVAPIQPDSTTQGAGVLPMDCSQPMQYTYTLNVQELAYTTPTPVP